jgi:hypothetical protein
LKARDETELQEWIEDLRAGGLEPRPEDASIALVVRRLARGETCVPWPAFRRSHAALRAVIEEGLARARGDESIEGGRTLSGDAAVAPFWHLLLSEDREVPVKDRLKAFVALEELKALPRCTCAPAETSRVSEIELDIGRAFLIRGVATKHYRLVSLMVAFPQTRLAVRDAIDNAIAAEMLEPRRSDDGT